MILTPEQIFSIALAAGFPRDSAIKATAIALKESGGNTLAHNGNAATGDNSYGLWQINMLDKPGYLLGAERRGLWNLATNDQLFDPATNARAAIALWNGSDANFDKHWYIEGRDAAKYAAKMPLAMQAASNVTGQPVEALTGADDGMYVALGIGLVLLGLWLVMDS